MRTKIAAILIFVVCMVIRGEDVSKKSTLESAAGAAVIDGCPVLPADNIWNTPIDTLPVHADSNLYINTIGPNTAFHPDFGSGLWDGGPIGIPFVTVGNGQPMVTVAFDYDDESDPGPYPVPPDAPIEGGSNSDGDRHVLVIDRDNCILYELYHAFPQPNGSWYAGSGAIFDLNSNALRPDTWTSADAVKIKEKGTTAADVSDSGFTIAPPPSLDVTSPNGGESLGIGRTHDFTWDAVSLSNPVKITLWQNGLFVGIIADNIDFLPGVYSWTVGDYGGGTAAAGSGYMIKIKEKSTLVADFSDSSFSIAVPSVSVVSPDGGESWSIGSSREIAWDAAGVTADLKLTLWKDDVYVGVIANNIDVSSGSYSWSVGEFSGGTAAAGTGYRVKIKEKGTDAADFSNSDFTLIPR